MSPFYHYFTSFSGIRDTAAASSYPDGVRQRIFQLRGPKTLAEATFSTPFDPDHRSGDRTKRNRGVDRKLWISGNLAPAITFPRLFNP